MRANRKDDRLLPVVDRSMSMQCDYLPVRGGHVVTEESGRGTVAEDRWGTLGYDHIVVSRHLSESMRAPVTPLKQEIPRIGI